MTLKMEYSFNKYLLTTDFLACLHAASHLVRETVCLVTSEKPKVTGTQESDHKIMVDEA